MDEKLLEKLDLIILKLSNIGGFNSQSLNDVESKLDRIIEKLEDYQEIFEALKEGNEEDEGF